MLLHKQLHTVAATAAFPCSNVASAAAPLAACPGGGPPLAPVKGGANGSGGSGLKGSGPLFCSATQNRRCRAQNVRGLVRNGIRGGRLGRLGSAAGAATGAVVLAPAGWDKSGGGGNGLDESGGGGNCLETTRRLCPPSRSGRGLLLLRTDRTGGGLERKIMAAAAARRSGVVQAAAVAQGDRNEPAQVTDETTAAAAEPSALLPRAVVVGGGPCGSLTAIALAQCGFRVDVYEREEQKKVVSAPAADFSAAVHAAAPAAGAAAADADAASTTLEGDVTATAAATSAAAAAAISALMTERFTFSIRLTPRGLGAIERFGASLPDTAFDLHGTYVHSARGPKFISFGTRAVHVDRNSLSSTLRQQAANHASGRITIHHGMRLREIDADCTTATFVQTAAEEGSAKERASVSAGAGAAAAEAGVEAAGSEETVRVTGFDLLVAADGAKSVCRAQVLKHDPTFKAKQVQSQGTFKRIPPIPLEPLLKCPPWNALERAATAIHGASGKQTQLIVTPRPTVGLMSGGWISAEKKLSFDQLKTPADVERILRSEFPQLFDSLVAARPDLCEALLAQPTGVSGWSVWCNRLHWKRMVMVGDAAHAMLATLGQGCNAALEDVPVLVEVLEQNLPSNSNDLSSAIPDALAKFTDARLADALAAVDLSHSPPVFPFAQTTFARLRFFVEAVVYAVAVKILPGLPKRPMIMDRMNSYSQIKEEAETDSRLARVVLAVFATAIVAVALGVRAYMGR